MVSQLPEGRITKLNPPADAKTSLGLTRSHLDAAVKNGISSALDDTSPRGQAGHRVSVLLYSGMSAFEIGAVTEVFGVSRPEFDVDWYKLLICAEVPGPVPMVGGATIQTDYGLDVFASADTVIVPGVDDVRGACSSELVAALRHARGRGARVVSMLSGAFALAAAGLLDGRRATTHWRYAPLLAQRFPRVEVDPHALYVDDGDVLTGAGSAAGLDLCLHLVRNDFNSVIADALARLLVNSSHSQSHHAETTGQHAAGDSRIAQSMKWALAHLAQQITVECLARQAHMSTRTYQRHFSRYVGSSPVRWLIAQRVQASLSLLEKTDFSVEQIAAAVGFETVVTYRHHFARAMYTSPSAYRRALRSPPPGMSAS